MGYQFETFQFITSEPQTSCNPAPQLYKGGFETVSSNSCEALCVGGVISTE